MQLDALLEIAIGLVMTWLILSMATSQIQDLIVEWLGWRSTFLENQLIAMLNDRELIKQFYNHPLIQPLHSKSPLGKDRKPTNIPNPIFAKATVDVLLNAGKTVHKIPADSMNLAEMRQSLSESMKHFEENNQYLARTLKYFAPNIGEDVKWVYAESKILENKLAEYRSNIESWFDASMTQASTNYKKNSQTFALLIGFIIAVIFNVDSFHITNQLWRDPTIRQAVVAQAGNIDPKEPTSFDATMAKLEALHLPVGWNETTTPNGPEQWPLKIIGFFVSGVAATQGSPFWFDILRNLTGLKKTEPSQKPKTD